jgi:hypothetical protein
MLGNGGGDVQKVSNMKKPVTMRVCERLVVYCYNVIREKEREALFFFCTYAWNCTCGEARFSVLSLKSR